MARRASLMWLAACGFYSVGVFAAGTGQWLAAGIAWVSGTIAAVKA